MLGPMIFKIPVVPKMFPRWRPGHVGAKDLHHLRQRVEVTPVERLAYQCKNSVDYIVGVSGNQIRELHGLQRCVPNVAHNEHGGVQANGVFFLSPWGCCPLAPLSVRAACPRCGRSRAARPRASKQSYYLRGINHAGWPGGARPIVPMRDTNNNPGHRVI